MKFLTLIMMLNLLVGIGAGMAAEPSKSAAARPPLPPDGIRVIPPDSKVPADLRPLSGNWYGEWVDPAHPDRPIPEILVVEEMVSQDNIKVIFSWGDCPVCKTEAKWRRFTGKIVSICVDWQSFPKPFSQVNAAALGQKKLLLFSYPEGRTFAFVLDDSDHLIGTDGVGCIRMTRLK